MIVQPNTLSGRVYCRYTIKNSRQSTICPGNVNCELYQLSTKNYFRSHEYINVKYKYNKKCRQYLQVIILLNVDEVRSQAFKSRPSTIFYWWNWPSVRSECYNSVDQTGPSLSTSQGSRWFPNRMVCMARPDQTRPSKRTWPFSQSSSLVGYVPQQARSTQPVLSVPNYCTSDVTFNAEPLGSWQSENFTMTRPWE